MSKFSVILNHDNGKAWINGVPLPDDARVALDLAAGSGKAVITLVVNMADLNYTQANEVAQAPVQAEPKKAEAKKEGPPAPDISKAMEYVKKVLGGDKDKPGVLERWAQYWSIPVATPVHETKPATSVPSTSVPREEDETWSTAAESQSKKFIKVNIARAGKPAVLLTKMEYDLWRASGVKNPTAFLISLGKTAREVDVEQHNRYLTDILSGDSGVVGAGAGK